MLSTIRYVLPAVVILGGMLLVVIEPNATGIEGAAMAIGSGLAILLLNVLFRMGVEGDRERVAEDAARDYFTLHGRWPDE